MKAGNTETYQVHRDLIYPLLWMQQRGMRVDTEGMKKLSAELLVQVGEAQERLNSLAETELNPNSPKQLREYFYISKHLPPYLDRKTHKPTVDEEALKRISRKGFEEAHLILDIRHKLKLRGTYLEVKLGEDNRLRSSMNPVGTRSGRLSSSKDIFGEGLNVQTLPGAMKQFICADEGYILYNSDKAQAENRVVAYIAPDLNMINAFENKIDIHKQTASMIFNKPVDQISTDADCEEDPDRCARLGNGTRSERYFGKEANHALNYGLGVKTFSLRLEIPEAEAKMIRERYFSGYPGVRTYHNWVMQRLQKTKTLVNCFGRMYHFLDRIDDSSLTDALYFIPQSTVADVINRWGILFLWNNPLFEGLELLNQVHDSLVYQIPISLGWEKHFEMVSSLVNNLDQPLSWEGQTFSIPTDTKMGLRLSDMVEHKGVLSKDKFKQAFERFSK
jgi:DNA polymerase-1